MNRKPSPQRSTRSQTTSGTRERIVEAARYLFWEKGYAATGLAEILARADANSGSFYHFFDSKDAVLRTVSTRPHTRDELVAALREGRTTFDGRAGSEGSASFAPSGVLKISLRSEEDAALFAEVRDLLLSRLC